MTLFSVTIVVVGGALCANRRVGLPPEIILDGRRCMNENCNKPLRPAHVAVYHTNECASADA